jgi:hypothetical protein
MEQIQAFIKQVSTGQAAEAQDTLNNLISAKAMEALANKKQEMASGVFNGKEAESTEETA